MGAASELRAEIPPAVALRVGEALSEEERSVQVLTSLVALLDASVRTAEPLIASLGEIIDRAVRLAAPAVGRRVSITTNVPREPGVMNRGSVLESLVGLLIVDLARASDGRRDQTTPRCVRVDGEIGRRGLVLEISSDGARPEPDSWRLLLAADLAAKLDATLVCQPDVASYVVQFR